MLTAGKNVDRLNNVSVQLRHKSVKTTEGFYLQLMRAEAQDSIKDAWKETEIE